jgi:hypothetical protein
MDCTSEGKTPPVLVPVPPSRKGPVPVQPGGACRLRRCFVQESTKKEKKREKKLGKGRLLHHLVPFRREAEGLDSKASIGDTIP